MESWRLKHSRIQNRDVHKIRRETNEKWFYFGKFDAVIDEPQSTELRMK